MESFIASRLSWIDRSLAESARRRAALGTDGRLVLLQLEELMVGVDEDHRLLIQDYRTADAPDTDRIVDRLARLDTEEIVDVVDTISSEFPKSALLIIFTTLIVLTVLLRSIVLPIKAVIMNTLSILASFGALVWIFQEGNLSALLGFAPLGFVETTIPVILFCVLFGLSMDYEVFLLTRMREIYDRTGDNTAAVAGGLERSGRIITSAALIVVVVAGSFAFAEIVLIKALGVGVALAVAADATIVRALLVPATMRLLGGWNWWAPRWLDRLLAGRIASEAEAEAAYSQGVRMVTHAFNAMAGLHHRAAGPVAAAVLRGDIALGLIADDEGVRKVLSNVRRRATFQPVPSVIK